MIIEGWEDEWTWYLCNCPGDQNGGGGGGGGGGYPSPEECRRDNPNRPPNCPNIEDCMDTTNLPAFCQNMCLNMNPPPPFCQNVSPQTGSTAIGTTRSNMVTVGGDDDHACSVTYHMLTLIFLILFSVVIL